MAASSRSVVKQLDSSVQFSCPGGCAECPRWGAGPPKHIVPGKYVTAEDYGCQTISCSSRDRADGIRR